MTFAFALCLLAKLCAGGRVMPGTLELACTVVQAELGKGQWSAGGDVSWQVRWVHWDDWTLTPAGWAWHCTEFDPKGKSLLVRQEGCLAECLVNPCEADSCGFVVTEGHDPPYLLTQGRPPQRDGWIVHHIVEVVVADDARRRVLARELYGLLPAGMRCK
jgi:hypothetical protein